MVVSIYAYDIERARKEVKAVLEEASTLKEPYKRVSCYNMVSNSLLNTSMGTGSTKGYDRLYTRKDALTTDIVRAIYDDPRLYKQLLDDYREWIALGKESKTPIEEGIPYMLLGFFYHTGGKNAEALDAMQTALEHFDRGKVNLLSGIMHLLIGMNHIREEKKEEAKKSLEKSLKKFAEQGDKKNAASIGSFLGLLCRDMGKLDESLSYYEKALRVARESGNKRLTSSVLVGMGYTWFTMKRPGEAEQCYKDALLLQQESANRKEQALTWLFLGRLEESRGATRASLDYYHQSLRRE